MCCIFFIHREGKTFFFKNNDHNVCTWWWWEENPTQFLSPLFLLWIPAKPQRRNYSSCNWFWCSTAHVPSVIALFEWEIVTVVECRQICLKRMGSIHVPHIKSCCTNSFFPQSIVEIGIVNCMSIWVAVKQYGVFLHFLKSVFLKEMWFLRQCFTTNANDVRFWNKSFKVREFGTWLWVLYNTEVIV